jgi:cytochrome c oxidase cbb3-type subunit IV
MELESMRSLITVAAFITFIGIVAWAWSARKRADFDTAANSVLIEDGGAQPQTTNTKVNGVNDHE